MKQMVGIGFLGLLLAGCGGGGGGGGASVPTPVPTIAAPTVTLSLAAPTVRVGQTTSVTWSSTNAASCAGADSLSGALPTNGSSNVTATIGGHYNYTVTCTGSGGTAKQTATLVVPMPVLKSSYENKMAAGDPSNGTGLPYLASGFLSTATAFADFFQDGSYSMVSHSSTYDPSNASTANMHGGIYFYKKDATGKWVDRTSDLLKETSGCVHPRKAIVADFNGDSRPDVYFACHGFDAPPFPGEQPHLLLSQADGTYKNITLPITCYCHGATAADLNGDGKADLIVTDTSIALIPYALINSGDGTSFSQDFSRISGALKGLGGIYSVELIDTGSGKYDLFLGSGTPPGSDPAHPNATWAMPNGILKNDGNGSFLNTPLIALPNPPGSTGIVYGLALDFVVANGFVYYQQINGDWDLGNLSYANTIVHKAKLSDMTATTLYEHVGKYNNYATWFPWLSPDNNGTMKVQCDQYVYDQSSLPGSSCAVSFPM
jgi:hypothetical protein